MNLTPLETIEAAKQNNNNMRDRPKKIKFNKLLVNSTQHVIIKKCGIIQYRNDSTSNYESYIIITRLIVENP